MLSSPLNADSGTMLDMDLSERILEILNDMKWTPAELSRQSGVSRSLLSQYLDGKVRNITLPTARKISKATGYNHIWIMDGTGIKKGSKVLSVIGGGKPDKRYQINTDILKKPYLEIEYAIRETKKVLSPEQKWRIFEALCAVQNTVDVDADTVKAMLKLASG